MAQMEKTEYNRQSYIKKLKDAKEIYAKRKNFLKEFSLKPSSSKDGEKNDSSDSSGDFVASPYDPNGHTPKELEKMSIKGISGLTADEINNWVNPKVQSKKCENCGERSHMYNSGDWFIEAEKKAGYRADAIVAHAAWESGWGTSNIACKKKNYFGYGAVDSDPMNQAYSWDTHREGVIGAAEIIARDWVYRSKNHKGQGDQDSFYLMDNPTKVGNSAKHWYASDHQKWVSNICLIWSKSPAPASKKKDTKKAKSMAVMSVDVEDRNTTVNGLPTQEELENLRRASYNYQVPLGSIKGMYFKSPKHLRERYVVDRKASQSFKEKINYAPLPDNEFIHLAGPHENYYPKETRQAFLLLKNRLGNRQITVVRGFDPNTRDTSSHSVGIALDIFVSSPTEALRVADTAWVIGFRAIALGPNFVHVDTGPEATWGYGNLPVYQGPGTVKVGELKYGYR